MTQEGSGYLSSSGSILDKSAKRQGLITLQGANLKEVQLCICGESFKMA